MSAACYQKPKDENNTTIILAAVLYGCNIWSVILRQEFRLKVLENRLLRKIYGPKGDEVTGNVMGLHNVNFMIFVPQQILCKN
jgi:hypothetical protein